MNRLPVLRDSITDRLLNAQQGNLSFREHRSGFQVDNRISFRMVFAPTPTGFPIRHSAASIRLARRIARLAFTLLNSVGVALLRAILPGLVFAASATVMLHYLGVSLPSLSELLDKLEDLGRLAKILS